MKSERNIFIAFILNLIFSIFEFIGGIFTGSIAIMSDALHDLGDAVSIGTAFFLEKKSKKKANNKYTYGYLRFSLLGSLITMTILTVGSVIVIYNSVLRLINPINIDYNGIILFAVIGIGINLASLFFIKDGKSLNERGVYLHMLEDALGWIVVLAGAIIMRFTDFVFIDSLMSIGIATFILINAIKGLRDVFFVFLDKVPCGIKIDEILHHIKEVEGVIDVHHLHISSIDGFNHLGSVHIVVNEYDYKIKNAVRDEFKEHNINHVTIEMELRDENCLEKECVIKSNKLNSHHHHH